MKLKIALNLDDGGPVNPMIFMEPWKDRVRLIPNSFTRTFAELCCAYGVKGKFSVVPMPNCLGRIDEHLNTVSNAHLRGFLSIVRKIIEPNFDLTPEILTHDRAYLIKQKRYAHEFEDTWFHLQGVEAKTDYISFALRIFKNVSFPVTGITSPWSTGISKEKEYAEAIGRAFKRVFRRTFAWYCLHFATNKGFEPRVAWRDRTSGITVVHVPWTTDDHFWTCQEPGSVKVTRENATRAVDSLLTRDGKHGRLRELADRQMPMVICTHWQSMFSEGRGIGLGAFEQLVQRIQRTFGDDLQWMRCSEMARAAVKV